MFLSLPFCFAFGFAIASGARGVYRWYGPQGGAPWEAAQRRREAALRACLGAVFGFVLVYLVMLRLPGDPYGLRAAALTAGGVAGWWFWTTRSARDRAIFSAGSVIFILAAALQYDTGFLSHVTKFGAGSVSIELSEAKRSTGALDAFQNGLDPDDTGSSPNTNRTDLALEWIFNLADYAIEDEQFARSLGARKSPVAIDQELRDQADPDARDFIDYACERIGNLAAKFLILQSVHRSEIASLAVDPHTVALMRRAYYALPRENKRADPAWQVADEVDCTQSGKIERIGPALYCAGRWAEEELRAVDTEAKKVIDDSDFFNFHEMQVSIDNDFDADPKSARRVSPVVDALNKLPSSTRRCAAWPSYSNLNIEQSMSAEHSRNSLFGGYLAILTAESLAAIGNAESAVQLLDAQIDDARAHAKDLKRTYDNQTTSDRTQVMPVIRAYLQIVRLEKAQLDLAIPHFLTQGRTPSLSAGWAVLIRLQKFVADVEAALGVFSDADDVKPIDLFRTVLPDGERAPKSGDLCPKANQQRNQEVVDVRYAAAKLASVEIQERNNALDLVAQNPTLARAFPQFTPWLDESAELLKSVDFKCFTTSRVNVEVASDRVPAFVQHSVGAYQESRADDFGAASDADAHDAGRDAKVAKRLCEAKGAFLRAIKVIDDVQSEVEATQVSSAAQPFANPPPTVDLRVFNTALGEAVTRITSRIDALPPDIVDKARQNDAQCADAAPAAQ